MKPRFLASFIVFAVMIAGTVKYIASFGVRLSPPQDSVRISMQVPDVNGLVVDSSVLLRGVPVGKVTGVHTALAGATVDFYVEKRFPIPVDSEVRLENLSALGESYIGFVPRTESGPMLADGQRVATENVRAPASVLEFATTMARFLDQLDPVRLARITEEIDLALPETDATLPNLIRASLLARGAVRGLDGRGSALLENLQTLLRNAEFAGPGLAQITEPLTVAEPEVSGLLQQAEKVVLTTGSPQAMRNIGQLFGRVQRFLDERSPDLKVFAEAFAPNIKAIAAAEMNFDSGRILSNLLDAVPADGTVRLHVRTAPP